MMLQNWFIIRLNLSTSIDICGYIGFICCYKQPQLRQMYDILTTIIWRFVVPFVVPKQNNSPSCARQNGLKCLILLGLQNRIGYVMDWFLVQGFHCRDFVGVTHSEFYPCLHHSTSTTVRLRLSFV